MSIDIKDYYDSIGYQSPDFQQEDSQDTDPSLWQRTKNWFGNAGTAIGSQMDTYDAQQSQWEALQNNTADKSPEELAQLNEAYKQAQIKQIESQQKWQQARAGMGDDWVSDSVSQLGGTVRGLGQTAKVAVPALVGGAGLAPFTGGASLIGVGTALTAGGIYAGHREAQDEAINAGLEKLKETGNMEEASAVASEVYGKNIPATVFANIVASRIGSGALKSVGNAVLPAKAMDVIGGGASKLSAFDIPSKVAGNVAVRTGSPLAGKIAGTVTTGLGDALTEGGQEVYQNYVSDSALGKPFDITSQENIDAFRVGATLGGFGGTVGGVLEGKGMLKPSFTQDADTIKYGKDIASETFDNDKLTEMKKFIGGALDLSPEEAQAMDTQTMARAYRTLYKENSTLTDEQIEKNLFDTLHGEMDTDPTKASEAFQAFNARRGVQNIPTIVEEEVEVEPQKVAPKNKAMAEQVAVEQKLDEINNGKPEVQNPTKAKESGIKAKGTQKFFEGDPRVNKIKKEETPSTKYNTVHEMPETIGEWEQDYIPENSDDYLEDSVTYTKEVNGETHSIRVERNRSEGGFNVIGDGMTKPNAYYKSLDQVESYLNSATGEKYQEDSAEDMNALAPDPVQTEINSPQMKTVKVLSDLADYRRANPNTIDTSMYLGLGEAISRFGGENLDINLDLNYSRAGIRGSAPVMTKEQRGAKAIINLYKGASVDTAIHEIAHVGWANLSEQDKTTFAKYAMQTQMEFSLKAMGMEDTPENRQALLNGQVDFESKLGVTLTASSVKQSMPMFDESLSYEQRMVGVEERFCYEFTAWYMSKGVAGVEPRNIIEKIYYRASLYIQDLLGIIDYTAQKQGSVGHKVFAKMSTKVAPQVTAEPSVAMPQEQPQSVENVARPVPQEEVVPTGAQTMQSPQATSMATPKVNITRNSQQKVKKYSPSVLSKVATLSDEQLSQWGKKVQGEPDADLMKQAVGQEMAKRGNIIGDNFQGVKEERPLATVNPENKVATLEQQPENPFKANFPANEEIDPETFKQTLDAVVNKYAGDPDGFKKLIKETLLNIGQQFKDGKLTKEQAHQRVQLVTKLYDSAIGAVRDNGVYRQRGKAGMNSGSSKETSVQTPVEEKQAEVVKPAKTANKEVQTAKKRSKNALHQNIENVTPEKPSKQAGLENVKNDEKPTGINTRVEEQTPLKTEIQKSKEVPKNKKQVTKVTEIKEEIKPQEPVKVEPKVYDISKMPSITGSANRVTLSDNSHFDVSPVYAKTIKETVGKELFNWKKKKAETIANDLAGVKQNIKRMEEELSTISGKQLTEKRKELAMEIYRESVFGVLAKAKGANKVKNESVKVGEEVKTVKTQTTTKKGKTTAQKENKPKKSEIDREIFTQDIITPNGTKIRITADQLANLNGYAVQMYDEAMIDPLGEIKEDIADRNKTIGVLEKLHAKSPNNEEITHRLAVQSILLKVRENVLAYRLANKGAERKQNAGVNAKNADISALQSAINLEASGKTRKQIKKATGWFKGDDGKWRFEIPDDIRRINDERIRHGFYEMQDITAKMEKIQKEIDKSPDNEYELLDQLRDLEDELHSIDSYFDLEDIYDAPELYKAYPQLREMRVYLTHNDEYLGVYNGTSIELSDTNIEQGRKPTELQETLMHELQHAIQDIEGFARGGNSISAKFALSKVISSIQQAVQRADVLVQDYYQVKKDSERNLKELKQFLNGEKTATSAYIKKLKGKVEQQIKTSKVFAKQITPEERKKVDELINVEQRLSAYSPDEAYTNLAGEIEANETARRAYERNEVFFQKMFGKRLIEKAKKKFYATVEREGVQDKVKEMFKCAEDASIESQERATDILNSMSNNIFEQLMNWEVAKVDYKDAMQKSRSIDNPPPLNKYAIVDFRKPKTSTRERFQEGTDYIIDDDLVNHIYNYALENGGATIRSDGKVASFRKGYQYATTNNSMKLSEPNILAYLKESLSNIVNNKRTYIGLWIDDGKLYVDKSHHTNNLIKAHLEGAKYNQDSIWDWKAMNSIKVDREILKKMQEPFEKAGVEERYSLLAWTGSGGDFIRPSVKYIGSEHGEQNQAHGWGLYFAFQKMTANGYRSRKARKRWVEKETKREVSKHEAYAEVHNGNTLDGWGEKTFDFSEHKKGLREGYAENHGEGTLLQATIPDQEWYIDEDKTFEKQHPSIQNKIRKAYEKVGDTILEQARYIVQQAKDPKIVKLKDKILKNELETLLFARLMVEDGKILRTNKTSIFRDLIDNGYNHSFIETIATKSNNAEDYFVGQNIDGRQVYRDLEGILNSDRQASMLLREVGIRGITYDGRRDGKCVVVFDGRYVRTVGKNGIAVNPKTNKAVDPAMQERLNALNAGWKDKNGVIERFQETEAPTGKAVVDRDVRKYTFTKSALKYEANRKKALALKGSQYWKEIKNSDGSVSYERTKVQPHQTKEFFYDNLNTKEVRSMPHYKTVDGAGSKVKTALSKDKLYMIKNKKRTVVDVKDFIVETLFNDKHALYKIAKSVGKLRDYQRLMVYKDQGFVAEEAITKGIVRANKTRTKGLFEIRNAVGEEKIHDFLEYAIAHRVIDLSKRGITQKMNVEEANQIIESVKKSPDAKLFEEQRKHMVDYNRELLHVLVDGGIISEGQFQNLIKADPNYIPLNKKFDSEEFIEGIVTNKSMINLAIPLHKIKGSTREIQDPFTSMAKNTVNFYAIASRNKSGLIFINDIVGAIVKDIDGKDYAPNSALCEEISSKKGNKEPRVSEREQIFYVWDNGKKRYYQIADRSAYRALKSFNSEQLTWIAKCSTLPARMLRTGATITPDFGLRNLIRDNFEAFISSRHGFLPLVDSFWGIKQLAQDTAWAKEYLNYNGEFNTLTMDEKLFTDINGVLPTTSVFKTLVSPKSSTGQRLNALLHVVPATYRGSKQKIQYLNNLLELGTRIGEYKNARMGYEGLTGRLSNFSLSPQVENAINDVYYSSYISKDITLNFGQHGTVGKQLNKYIPFFNASLQGTYKIMNTIGDMANVKNDPKRASELYFKMSLCVAMAVLTYSMGQDDKEYLEASRNDRERFWIFGGVRVPKDQLFGELIGSNVEAMLEYMDKKNPERLKDAMVHTMDALTPNYAPTVGNILIGLIGNYDSFTHRAIVPEYQQKLRGHLQTDVNTNQLAEFLSNSLWSFGIDASAKKIDWLLQNTISNGAKYINAVYDLGFEPNEKMARGGNPTANFLASEVPPVANIVTGSFTTSNKSYRTVNDFYTQYAEYEKMDNSKEKLPTNIKWETWQSVMGQIKNINKELKKIKSDEKLSGEQKRVKAQPLMDKQLQLAHYAFDKGVKK